jgi:DNA-binding IclR family transcriptional regulator
MHKSKPWGFYNNKSLERALQILTKFNGERPNFGLSELSAAALVPKTTVLRLCSTLEQTKYLKLTRKGGLCVRQTEPRHT